MIAFYLLFYRFITLIKICVAIIYVYVLFEIKMVATNIVVSIIMYHSHMFHLWHLVLFLKVAFIM